MISQRMAPRPNTSQRSSSRSTRTRTVASGMSTSVWPVRDMRAEPSHPRLRGILGDRVAGERGDRPAVHPPLERDRRILLGYEVQDIVDAGDSVLVLGRICVRGVQSGATGTQHGALVFGIRDGLVVAYRSYIDRDEALADVGLKER